MITEVEERERDRHRKGGREKEAGVDLMRP